MLLYTEDDARVVRDSASEAIYSDYAYAQALCQEHYPDYESSLSFSKGELVIIEALDSGLRRFDAVSATASETLMDVC